MGCEMVGSEVGWLERVEALWFDRRHCRPPSHSHPFPFEPSLRYSLALLDKHFVVRGVVDLIAFLLRPVPPARGRFEPRPLPMGGHHCGGRKALVAPPLRSSCWRWLHLWGWVVGGGVRMKDDEPMSPVRFDWLLIWRESIQTRGVARGRGLSTATLSPAPNSNWGLSRKGKLLTNALA